MPTRRWYRYLAATLALMNGIHAAAFRIADNRSGTFGIYELVDCRIAGAKTKLMKAGTGAQVYCIAAKAIVDQKQLSWAEAALNESGTPYLSLQLNKEG